MLSLPGDGLYLLRESAEGRATQGPRHYITLGNESTGMATSDGLTVWAMLRSMCVVRDLDP